jgi:hypothetical protein
LKQYGVMAVRFIQEEDLDGMQLLSGSKESFGQGSAKTQAAGKR